MSEILASIKRVSDVIGEITVASQEQIDGFDQINQAIVQIDHTTQQNAALVEETASAAASLQEQTGNLMRVVNVFRVGGAYLAEAVPGRLQAARRLA